jgi:hypothetical protein
VGAGRANPAASPATDFQFGPSTSIIDAGVPRRIAFAEFIPQVGECTGRYDLRAHFLRKSVTERGSMLRMDSNSPFF